LGNATPRKCSHAKVLIPVTSKALATVMDLTVGTFCGCPFDKNMCRLHRHQKEMGKERGAHGLGVSWPAKGILILLSGNTWGSSRERMMCCKCLLSGGPGIDVKGEETTVSWAPPGKHPESRASRKLNTEPHICAHHSQLPVTVRHRPAQNSGRDNWLRVVFDQILPTFHICAGPPGKRGT
jgi:hypothetical protein